MQRDGQRAPLYGFVVLHRHHLPLIYVSRKPRRLPGPLTTAATLSSFPLVQGHRDVCTGSHGVFECLAVPVTIVLIFIFDVLCVVLVLVIFRQDLAAMFGFVVTVCLFVCTPVVLRIIPTLPYPAVCAVWSVSAW